MRKLLLNKRVFFIALLSVLFCSLPLVAEAATPANPYIASDFHMVSGCSIPNVLISGTPQNAVPMTEDFYLNAINTFPGKRLSTACRAVAISQYQTQVKKYVDLYNANFGNRFSSRYDSCTNYKGISITSPSTFAVAIKCLFLTSFVPSGDFLKIQLINTQTDLASHVPTSFIITAGGFISDVSNNWGSLSCSDSKGISTTVNFGTSTNQISQTFSIACKPPSAIAGLRKYMVIAEWLGFMFVIYFASVKRLKDLF